MTTPPVRIKDIARRLGISTMSVAVALRGMPGVSEKTRAAVKACAKKLGYRPDPTLAALADYRRRTRAPSSFAQLAYVTDYPIKNDPFWDYTNEFYYGARKRGLEYGYEVVPFWLREGGCSRRQASSVLFNRGIKGLLIAPLPVEEGGHLDDLTWKYFSGVALGISLASPQLDYAVYDHHHATQTVLTKLRERGYSRIGFAFLHRRSVRVRHAPLDAYLGDQYRHGNDDGREIPPFMPHEFSSAGFWAWFDAHKPDAIVTDASQVVPQLLAERGLRTPDDVGVACFSSRPSAEDSSMSGVIQDLEAIGAAAVDRLHTNLLRNIYGPPEHPQGSHMHGHWQEGKTLRKLPR